MVFIDFFYFLVSFKSSKYLIKKFHAISFLKIIFDLLIVIDLFWQLYEFDHILIIVQILTIF